MNLSDSAIASIKGDKIGRRTGYYVRTIVKKFNVGSILSGRFFDTEFDYNFFALRSIKLHIIS